MPELTAAFAGDAGPGRAWLVLAGWGIFNLIEGIIDHHLLELHHVNPKARVNPGHSTNLKIFAQDEGEGGDE